MILTTVLVVAFLGTLASGGENRYNDAAKRDHWFPCKPSDVYTPVATLNADWYKKQDSIGWYYVMGNEWHIVSTTKSLTGKPPPSEESVQKACFTSQRTPQGYVITGYSDMKADYECKKNDEGKEECLPTDHSTNKAAAAARGSTQPVVVWTDNKKYVLAVRCTGLHKTWSVRSSENADIDPATKKDVLKFIEAEKFKVAHAVTLTRKGCPALKPLEEHS